MDTVNTGNEAPEQAPTQDQDVSILQTALQEAEAKAQENWDNMLRSKAEADNARRRARIDVENAHKYGSEKFAKELLNVLDSLDRGLESLPTNASDDVQLQSIREGMELTHKLMLDTLKKFGITMIDPIGEKFNPKLHEALSMQPTEDSAANTILVVVQRGFVIHERVLRPARVIVASTPQKNT